MSFDRNRLPDPSAYFENRGLTLSGPRSAKWKTTRCEFHGGRDSMRVNTTSGAWVCMACGEKGGDVLAYEIATTGAEFRQAATSLGAWVDDGSPVIPQKPTPLSARAALSVLGFESLFVAIAAGGLAKGVALSDKDRNRLMKAVARINRLVECFK